MCVHFLLTKANNAWLLGLFLNYAALFGSASYYYNYYYYYYYYYLYFFFLAQSQIRRFELDERLGRLLRSIETQWFRDIKYLLLPLPADKSLAKALKDEVSGFCFSYSASFGVFEDGPFLSFSLFYFILFYFILFYLFYFILFFIAVGLPLHARLAKFQARTNWMQTHVCCC